MVFYTTPVVSALTSALVPGASPAALVPPSNLVPMCSLPTTQSICSLVAVPVLYPSFGIEQVWQALFGRFFSHFAPQKWQLVPVASRPEGMWHTFVDSAKVRFSCDACGHGWTSMKGRVTFWCKLENNYGVVAFRLYGQQCDKCKDNSYEPAMWYPEEIAKVLANIYHRVAHVFYGFAQPPIHRSRRPGKPRTPHNSERCQACKDGVCAERR